MFTDPSSCNATYIPATTCNEVSAISSTVAKSLATCIQLIITRFIRGD